MKAAFLAVLAVAMLLVAATLGRAQTGMENELRDNLLQLRQELQQTRDYAQDLRDNFDQYQVDIASFIAAQDLVVRQFLENRYNQLDNYVDEFYLRVTAELARNYENIENINLWTVGVLTALRENLFTKVTIDFEKFKRDMDASNDNFKAKVTANTSDRMTAMENEVGVLKNKNRQLELQLINEINNNIAEAGVGLGIMAVFGVIGIFYGLRNGTFSKMKPDTARTPKQKLIAAKMLLDYRLEEGAPEEEVVSAEARLEALKKMYPSEFEEAMKDMTRIRQSLKDTIKDIAPKRLKSLRPELRKAKSEPTEESAAKPPTPPEEKKPEEKPDERGQVHP